MSGVALGAAARLAARELAANRGRFALAFTSIMLGCSMSAATLSIMGSVPQYAALLIATSIGAVLTSMLTIRQAMDAAIESSARDYAIIMRLGSPTWFVPAVVVMETGAVSLAASTLGAVMGWNMAVILSWLLGSWFSGFTLNAVLNPWLLIMAAAVSVIASMLASAESVRTASGARPPDDGEPKAAHAIMPVASTLTIAVGVNLAHGAPRSLRIMAIILLMAAVYRAGPFIVSTTLAACSRLAGRRRVNAWALAFRTMSNDLHATVMSTMVYGSCIMLVAFGSVAAASRAGFLTTTIQQSIDADGIVYQLDDAAGPVRALRADASVAGAATMESWRTGSGNNEVRTFGVSNDVFDHVLRDAKAASDIRAGGTVAGAVLAKRMGWGVGTVVRLADDRSHATYTITGLTSQPILSTSLMVPADRLPSSVHGFTMIYLVYERGHGSGFDHDAVTRGIERRHDVVVAGKTDMAKAYTMPLYEGLLAFYGLVSMLITISLFGLMAASTLMTIRRRSDFETMARLGCPSNSMRAMLAARSLTPSVLGSLIGVVAGTVAGVLYSAGVGWGLAIPWTQVSWLVFVSAMFGLVASAPSATMLIRSLYRTGSAGA
jgi:predicted lysophospholipase L1 biosynthesis ABC-type transport system permease subunit